MMNVLLVSENRKHASEIRSALLGCGAACMHYRWFLKALDNVQEISPDFVIVDASDFPRHWKVMAQYLKNSTLENTRLILCVEDELSEDDCKKSDYLGVAGTVSFSDIERTRSELEKILTASEKQHARLFTVDSLFPEDEVSPVQDAKNIEDDVGEEEVPTVSGIFMAHGASLPESEFESDEKIRDEYILGENSLYSVDSLFGLEENDYSISTVDNLFYTEDGCENTVPESSVQCKVLVGSLLQRIREYYE